jgi:hypothetical protein
LGVKSAEWVNILENPVEDDDRAMEFEVKQDGIEVKADFRCFEIKTLKLVL